MHILDRLRIGTTTSSAAETQALAEELARALPCDATLALHGDLGVGKTTFVQGLARGFGVHEVVTSPTFNIYTLHRSATRTLVHLDAYRLESGRQVEDLLLEDFLISPWCLAVEWPEKIAEWIPSNAVHLHLGITANQQHTIQLNSTA
ncbi:MAG: tRNA (adenosine(37)-N6)-threonylcarbamoyltransferase complex ATPase subunit type 1 TsaE [Opitutus sp.]